ncbi:MAG TPA: hypothetical protein PKA56_09155 [Solirubrobacterales bacterium]|jgi:hypothetical protein|nr:hypothetical protein [Solirubrobacterales bacterium]HNA43633.1 hypothetical protein [Solirubrobacterales bacterium]HNF82727.1 hypothetical protein [Solirubrobacterales bacterium]HNH86292.1 hypothetical protein [Solirubrobacterales bacterium]HNK35005.1 hypothetical protein [Solirubrobacterales bacterium]
MDPERGIKTRHGNRAHRVHAEGQGRETDQECDADPKMLKQARVHNQLQEAGDQNLDSMT